MTDPDSPLTWRREVRPGDIVAVRELVGKTGFFNGEEIDIAEELVREHLARGEASGYLFLFAGSGGSVAGYTCYGPILGTAGSFDLFWIAVHPDFQGRGLGRRLMARTERLIADAGGRRIYAETSSREQYAPTRAFYERCDYRAEAVLTDFYGPGSRTR
jgi:D-alanine-D-alanine ligase